MENVTIPIQIFVSRRGNVQDRDLVRVMDLEMDLVLDLQLDLGLDSDLGLDLDLDLDITGEEIVDHAELFQCWHHFLQYRHYKLYRP